MTTLIDTTHFRELKGESNDCVVRAFSAASGLSYTVAYVLAKEAGRRPKKGFWSARILKQAKKQGLLDWTESNMYDQKKLTKQGYGFNSSPYPTLAQVLPLLSKGRFILETRTHAFAVVDGVVYDQGSKLKSRFRIVSIFEVKI